MFSSLFKPIVLALLILLSACTGLTRTEIIEDAIPGGKPAISSQLAAAGTHIASRNYGKIIIIGDSLMSGARLVNASNTETFEDTAAVILQREHGISVDNLSISGNAMQRAIDFNIGSAVNYLTADGSFNVGDGTAVVVELAHNDWYWGISSLSTLQANYIALLQSINLGKLDKVRRFCMLPTAAIHDYLHTVRGETSYEDVRDIVRSVANTGLCELIDTSDWFDQDDVNYPEMMPDGLHWSARAHEVVAQRLLLWLQEGR